MERKLLKKNQKILDPSNIERIDVLKGDKAKEKYGEKGKNGVLIIDTKKQ